MPNALSLRAGHEQGPEPTIARAGTSRTAFVGRTLRGPVNRPVFLKSFAEFQHVFGGLWQPSPLGYAVEQFFDNGGREAVVVRVVNGARAATLSLSAGAGVLRFRAVRPGSREFLRASVDYDNVPAGNAAEFNLTVQRVRVQGTGLVEDQEIFLRVSVDPGAERHVSRVFGESELVRLIDEAPPERPDLTLDAASGLATRYVNSNADGDDGAPLTDYDLIGSEEEGTGLFALDAGEPCHLLCIPPLSREQGVGPGVLLVAARYCKSRRSLLVVDPPADWHTADDALAGMRDWECASDNALMYFPRILAYDKLRGHFESFAPCGAVAGMLARADEGAPLWAQPGNEDAVLRPGFKPTCLVSEGKRMRLAALGVNTIQAARSAARIGVRPRTLAGGTATSVDWQYLGARRLALFILTSIERGTRWALGAEPSDDLNERVVNQVRRFFEELHEAGAFGERDAAESFFVICDDRLPAAGHDMPGEYHLLVGFAASRPREFHTFRIVHDAHGARITPASLNRLNAAQYSPEELEWIDTLASQLLS